MRWLLECIQRGSNWEFWRSFMLDVWVLTGYWGGLVPMPTSLTSPVILGSTWCSTSRTRFFTALQWPIRRPYQMSQHRLPGVPSRSRFIYHYHHHWRAPHWGDWGCPDRRDLVHCWWHLPSLFGLLAWTTWFWLHLFAGRGDYTTQPRAFTWLSPSPFFRGEFFEAGDGNLSSSGTWRTEVRRRRNSLQLLGYFCIRFFSYALLGLAFISPTSVRMGTLFYGVV